MTTLAIQYLESNLKAPIQDVRNTLRAAFERLPISQVIIGWDLPDELIDMCADECSRAKAQLYRWQPLLTGDGVFEAKTEWSTIGLNGEPVPGFEDLPEFTFACPNNSEVQDAVLKRIQVLAKDDRYHGLFLDRIRFPSPMEDPGKQCACFCKACQKTALSEGLDLTKIKDQVTSLLSHPEGVRKFIHCLFDAHTGENDHHSFQSLMQFRIQSITRLIRKAADIIHAQGKFVGLDCFSPALTRSVGQGLHELATCSDWVKIMSYAHTYGVAGLPFEFSAIARWLILRKGFTEHEAIQLLSEVSDLPFPESLADFRITGFAHEVLARETKRAVNAGVENCLPGIELVDEEDLTNLNPEQIRADLKAYRDAGAAGLVLSWDLWFMPLERLDLVREVWV